MSPILRNPLIGISADGSMAWAIYKFQLKYTYKDSTGMERSVEDTGAELVVYEKKNSKWFLVAAAELHQE